MEKMNRRNFLARTAAATGGAIVLSQIPSLLRSQKDFPPGGFPIGFQSFPIRDVLAKDFPGTLKMMAELGYSQVEMCSPAGYATIGFGPLVSLKPADIRQIIENAGLGCPSCHFGFQELKEQLDDRIEFAHQLGLKLMVCSTFSLPETAALKDYLNAADALNKIAEKIKASGLQCGFHNHDMEFHILEGQLIYEALMKEFDPKLVKMQFQTEVINLGYKAATYFMKYPGRFISSHLSDWSADKKEVPVGQGVIDWQEYFKAARTGGVEYFYVEMDMNTFRDSAVYIHNLMNGQM